MIIDIQYVREVLANLDKILGIPSPSMLHNRLYDIITIGGKRHTIRKHLQLIKFEIENLDVDEIYQEHDSVGELVNRDHEENTPPPPQNQNIQVLRQIDARTFNGLGYSHWLVVDRYGVNDCILVDADTDRPKVAHCHPTIAANNLHAENLGVEIGDLICGVRWFESYNGQPVANPPQ